MQAINHVATALVIKRAFPSAPLFGLILATELMEYMWVALNLLGVERTVVGDDMRSVADIHLVYMPFSHSIIAGLIVALAVGLGVMWRGGKVASACALAMSLGVFSHIVLDVAVHAHDIPMSPFSGGTKFGTGLYADFPLPALAFETMWGLLCWWIYRGNWKLLGLIAVLAITSIPFYSMQIDAGEGALGGQGATFAVIILVQMLATSLLVWRFAQ